MNTSEASAPLKKGVDCTATAFRGGATFVSERSVSVASAAPAATAKQVSSGDGPTLPLPLRMVLFATAAPPCNEEARLARRASHAEKTALFAPAVLPLREGDPPPPITREPLRRPAPTPADGLWPP